jgi:hypothetical protein
MYKIIGGDGNEYGPISADQLKQWISEGRVNAQTRVQAAGTTEWKPLGSFPELAGSAAPPAAQPGPAPLPVGSVPNYLVQSILVTIFCCLPLGVPAIVFAAQVNGKLQAGDIAGAQNSSRKAKMFCWWAVGVGLAWLLIWVAITLISAMAQVRSIQ